ncbi:MAG TPA: ABC transporter substrate-binding protein [Pseudonocardiaceae bacterium]
MKRHAKITAAVAFSLVSGLSVTACGTSGGSSSGGAGFGAATTAVVNASDATGGTINYVLSGTPESTDPGNIYYGYEWDFVRWYSRSLVSFSSAPGNAGLKLTPDLATGLGQVSADGLTWTYHLRPGLKFEDGTPITSKDVKYGIERSTNYSPDVLPNGPTYFRQYLTDPDYPGAYKDTSADKMGLTGISTPDDLTIVFHLQHPYADFDYLATLPETAPVPPAKDTGANYQSHPISSGPYEFQSYDPNKGFTLVKNPNWSAASDPTRKQLTDKIVVTYNVNANDVDNRLLNGTADVDLQGTGVQASARSKILNTASLKADSDSALTGRLWYAALNTQVAPLNNVHCREAIEYAVDKVADQTAYGGPVAGGQIATTVLPPNIIGYTKFDDYNAASQPHGDLAAARDQLKQCGQPNGFTVNISARTERPFEVNAAQAIQQALAQIGIKTDILEYPQGQYFTDFAGVPTFAQQHDLGIIMTGWQPDWPDGLGFFSQIVDGRAIKQAGNDNLEMENNPQVNSLLDQAAANPDVNARTAIYGQIDKLLMKDAVIVPMVYATTLLYRNPKLTNVHVSSAYGMYDYSTLGVKP